MNGTNHIDDDVHSRRNWVARPRNPTDEDRQTGVEWFFVSDIVQGRNANMTGRELARSPFVQITLPVMAVVIASAAFIYSSLNSRLDQIDDRFEQVDDRFDQVDARFDQVDDRFDQVDARFDQVDDRFEQVDARFEQVDARFEQVDARFEQVDARFEQVDDRFGQVDDRFDRVHADIDKLDGRVAKIEDAVSDIPGIQSRLDGIESDVAGLTRKVDTIENRLITTLENAVQELRKSRSPVQYGFSGDAPHVSAQVMDVLRGKEVRLPVAALVPNIGGVWADLHVAARFSENRFTVYPDTANGKLVEAFTNNHWKPVDSADLSKGLVETVP